MNDGQSYQTEIVESCRHFIVLLVSGNSLDSNWHGLEFFDNSNFFSKFILRLIGFELKQVICQLESNAKSNHPIRDQTGVYKGDRGVSKASKAIEKLFVECGGQRHVLKDFQGTVENDGMMRSDLIVVRWDHHQGFGPVGKAHLDDDVQDH